MTEEQPRVIEELTADELKNELKNYQFYSDTVRFNFTVYGGLRQLLENQQLILDKIKAIEVKLNEKAN
jgi:hypothetical protein